MAPGETRPHCKLGGVFASSYTCLAVIPSLFGFGILEDASGTDSSMIIREWERLRSSTLMLIVLLSFQSLICISILRGSSAWLWRMASFVKTPFLLFVKWAFNVWSLSCCMPHQKLIEIGMWEVLLVPIVPFFWSDLDVSTSLIPIL